MKEIENIVRNPNIIDPKVHEIITKIRDCEMKLSNISTVKIKMMKVEMDRLFIQFVKHDYERRFNIDKKTVIGALVGEENLIIEMNNQERRYRKLQQNLKIIRTFDPMEQVLTKSNTVKTLRLEEKAMKL